MKYIRKISILATGFVVLQLVLYNFYGYALRGFVPYLELYTEQYSQLDYEALYSTHFLRPTSFFLEPAHYARYAILGLIFLLWRRNVEVKDTLLAVFVSIGILVSTSSQGYVLLAIVWVAFLFAKLNTIQNRNTKIVCLFGVILLPLVLLIVLDMPAVQNTITRALSGSIEEGNTAIGARLGGFAEFGKQPFLKKIFGVGFGVVPEHGWLSSAAYWLYGSGIIVFGIYCLFLLNGIIKLRDYQKIVLLIFAIMFFTDDSFYSYMCVIFYSLAFWRKEDHYEKDSVHRNREQIS